MGANFVNVGIGTQHIFQTWKEDKSVDMEVLTMNEHLSISGRPQCQTSQLYLCFIAFYN